MYERVQPEDIRIVLDLARLGELAGAIATEVCRYRGLPDPDYDGEEGRMIALAAWNRACHMAERVEFVESIKRDLAALEVITPDIDVVGPS